MIECSRREFLRLSGGFTLAALLSPLGREKDENAVEEARPSKIDRKKVVRRHNPRFTRFDPFHTLSVGNGRFAFNVDITGLQTFTAESQNDFPLCTVSHWGWHSTPLPEHLLGHVLRPKEYEVLGRKLYLYTDSTGQEELFAWHRQNPHRFNLGKVGLHLELPDGRRATPADLKNCHQELDLWTGVVRSKFEFMGKEVCVTTVADAEFDGFASRIESVLLETGGISVIIAFPYGSPDSAMGRWDKPELHVTEVRCLGKNLYEFAREMDTVVYRMVLAFNGRAVIKQVDAHEYVLTPRGQREFEFVCFFKPDDGSTSNVPTFAQVMASSSRMWEQCWKRGGMIDFDGSTDPRAEELERRIILSLYQTAIHCSGPLPSQETGLLYNSWYGKFHLEMHWWHSVHFAVWDRFELFTRSLGIYRELLPLARDVARRQGFLGCRWPKMIGPDGIDSPSPVGPLLIWQQPHPIYYAALCYRRVPTQATLLWWKDIVFETADFMVSFLYYDSKQDRYVIGPPIKTVSENNDPMDTWNPTFELTYWRFGLRVAQEWRKRLGLKPNALWEKVLAKLALPSVSEGRYLMHEGLKDTYTRWNWEHPALVGAYGMLPGDGIDTAIMRESVKEVWKTWQWDRSWGWDFPLLAMAAARCGLPELAVDALLLPVEKNRYLPNGHNYQRPGLTAYLPGNGGLLSAVAMMVAGWDGDPRCDAPGFPKNGKWKITWEGLAKWM